MQKSNIILSIVIPTRNRASYLRQMLVSLCPQLKEYGENLFQVVIANNASTDDTEIRVEEIKHQYGISFEYYKHNHNIGLQNLDFAASKAVGKYTLLSGDDDVYAPNFITSIMPFLRAKEEYGLIHWNRLVGDEECSNTRIYNPTYKSAVQIFNNAGDFLQETLSSTNFISSLIYNTAYWQAVPNEKIPKEWEGYRAWGRILLGSVMQQQQCVTLYFPLVIQRNPSKEWTTRWAYYAIYEISNIFEVLDKYHPGLSNAWIKRLHDIKYYDINQMIDSVVTDIDYYRKCQHLIGRYLSTEEKKRMNMWLFAKNVERKRRVVYKFDRAKRLLKKLIK